MNYNKIHTNQSTTRLWSSQPNEPSKHHISDTANPLSQLFSLLAYFLLCVKFFAFLLAFYFVGRLTGIYFHFIYCLDTGNSASNSSGDAQSTSLRPFSRWSLCNSARSNKYPTRVPHRPYVAQYNARRWIVTTST